MTFPNNRMRCPRVLIVEDHPDTLELLGTVLSMAGCRVTPVRSAIDGMRIAGGDFDAIVTDLSMPAMDGAEFIAHVREARANREIPIIVVTGQPVGAGSAALERLGCCSLLMKPCDPRSLEATLNSLLAACTHDCRRCPVVGLP